jgi:hypothetical protein
VTVTEEMDIPPSPKKRSPKKTALPISEEAPFFLTEQHHNQV